MALKRPVRLAGKRPAGLAGRRLPRPTKAPTGLVRALAGIGMHGTRNWNANEMCKFGSAETYYYAPRGRTELTQMPKREVEERFGHSIRRNVSYWFDKHAVTVGDASKLLMDDFPAIVFVRHQGGDMVLPDNASMSHQDRMEPSFRAFSAPLESRDVLGSVTLSDAEYTNAIRKLTAKGKLNKYALVDELSRILVPKARQFVMARGMR